MINMQPEDYYKAKENSDNVRDAYNSWNYRYMYGYYHNEPDTHRP